MWYLAPLLMWQCRCVVLIDWGNRGPSVSAVKGAHVAQSSKSSQKSPRSPQVLRSAGAPLAWRTGWAWNPYLRNTGHRHTRLARTVHNFIKMVNITYHWSIYICAAVRQPGWSEGCWFRYSESVTCAECCHLVSVDCFNVRNGFNVENSFYLFIYFYYCFWLYVYLIVLSSAVKFQIHS